MEITLLILGSIAGGLSRWILSAAVTRTAGEGFPFGTLAVNSLGCLLIGFFYTAASQKIFISPQGKLLAMTGFCGAFTTFSALIFETVRLAEQGNYAAAAANLGISLILGFFFFYAGAFFGKLV